MANLWPWLAVAGLGGLHGLNPAGGWMLATAWGLRDGDAAQVRRALLPIALGHAASIAIVAGVVVQGLALDRALVQGLAGALLVAAATYRLLRDAGQRARVSTLISTPIGVHAGHAGITMWSFVMASAHGAGLMLVPALVPLCLSDNPAREITASGSLALAAAAVAVHTAAMLLTTGLVASGVYRGIALCPRLRSGIAPRQAWTAALALSGALLMALG